MAQRREVTTEECRCEDRVSPQPDCAVGIHYQPSKKGRGVREVGSDTGEMFSHSSYGQGSEPTDSVRGKLVEGSAGGHTLVTLEPYIDREGFRTLEVHASLIGVLAIEIGPQG